MTDPKTLISIQDLADYLGCSRRTIYRLIDKGMPHVRIGAHTRFDKGAAVNWMVRDYERRHPELVFKATTK